MEKHHGIGSLFYFTGHGADIQNNLVSGPILIDGVLPWRYILEKPGWNFSHQVTVILSSCLLGRQVNVGKEMLGMIAALFSKGASCVISALWAVDDEATAQFMPKLVEYLQENLREAAPHPRSQAMKAAMNDLRKLDNGRYDVPYFFAPFFVSGAP
jgi:CHAT domain-containing protein